VKRPFEFHSLRLRLIGFVTTFAQLRCDVFGTRCENVSSFRRSSFESLDFPRETRRDDGDN
jgi:hypothetical protein